MAHQLTITLTLTDAEYNAISEEVAMHGKPLESVVHEALTQYIKPPTSEKRQPTKKEITEYLYREGVITHIPTDEPDTPEEAAERERLFHLFSQGQPLSEMVIEGRGPY